MALNARNSIRPSFAMPFGAVLLASVAIGALPAPAMAQEGANNGDIIVTARRRNESLNNVPITMTALTGDQLAAKGFADITSLADEVPNVTLEPSRGTNSTLSAFIRGVGQQDPVSGFEQGVGIYLDDVYLNRPQAAVLDIYDVERVEVLRGPQGTLYGRNTIGGAIKYVTKKIDDKLHLGLRGTYGSYDQADGVATISSPITKDGLIRASGTLARLTRGGFGRNLTTGLSNYNKDIWAGRGTIEVHGDKIFARLTGDYTHDMSNPRGGHREIPGQYSGAPVLANVFDTQAGLNSPKQDVKAWGWSLFLEAKPTEALTLRSITAFRKDDSASPIDFDATASQDVDVPAYYRNKQWSQELQVLYSKGRFNGMAGFYYLYATALTQFGVNLFTNNAIVAGLQAYTDANIRTDTMAGFVNMSYDITDQISIEAGGRYTWDKRYAQILRQNYSGGGSSVFGGPGTPFGAASTNFLGSASYTKFTPRVSLNWRPDPNNTIYASFSQGFKGGGFDPRGVGVNAPAGVSQGQFLSFRPEKVDSYEIGLKTRLFDRKLALNLAAFRMDYKDVQIPGSVACTVGGLPSFCGVVSNAGKARMQGVEAEGRLKLGALSLNGSLGYIDAKYLQYITLIAGQPTDVAANRKVQNTPSWTGNASATYAIPVPSGSLDLSGGVSWKSTTYQFEIPNPYLDQPAYALFDASLVYRAPGGRWTLGVYGKNLADKRYKTSGYTYVSANATTGALNYTSAGNLIPTLGKEGVLTTYWGNPRQVFATATVNF
ncbi:TonB-dependent receptor [Novosphingobium humi]|uniref:TonB-dependent receptor n=1 Tax=Novosphingobium humi TaxID=2282397 RepID=A0ABY7TXU8_9SPHN|nr:TonB-dependent receptor [Novosphingobium humi]WCT78095.1 TonB-dependent receptor [Novosphingobium humi]